MNVLHVAPGQGTHFRMIDGDHVAKAVVRDDAGTFEVFEVLAHPGPMTPPHAAPWSGVLFLLEGHVAVHAEGTTYDVEAGGVVVLPAGTAFTFEVLGDHARIVAITSGERAGRFFAEISAVPMDQPLEDTMQAVRAVTARHGVSVEAPAPAPPPGDAAMQRAAMGHRLPDPATR